jgi:hypothetical protein
MICRNCGTEIADKAIVCYRCGAATAESRHRPRPPARGLAGSRLRMRLALFATIVAIIVAAVLVLPQTPEGWPRAAGYAGVAVITFGAVSFIRRRFGH